MPKKLLTLIIISGLVGGIIGSLLAAHFTSASFLDDVWNYLRGASSTVPSILTPAPLYKPAVDYENAVVQAVEIASPSVVSVVISKDLPVIEQCPYNPFGDLPPEFQQFFGDQGSQFSQPCQKGTKYQEVGGGSGFIISEDGLILTNKHVVADTKADYTVLTNDGKKYTATVLARDPVNDLAVIKINTTGLTPAKLGDSTSLKLGQTAIAIGNALGEFRNTVSVGVISGLSRTVTASGTGFGSETIQGVIQTDAAINPGNSGGPLLNLRGEVIGINTAIASGAQNIGFALPINQAKRDIDSIKKNGSIKIPYIGVRYTIVDENLAKDQKLPVDYGALVRGSNDGPAVIKNSPAAKAGIQAEDIIIEVNGERIDNDNPLGMVVQKYSIGDTLTVKVRRGDKTLTFQVTLEERPEL